MEQVVLFAPGGSITWVGTEYLPESARAIIQGFKELSNFAPISSEDVSPRVDLTIQVDASLTKIPLLGSARPVSGPMSKVPLNDAVTMDCFETRNVWSWKGGGTLIFDGLKAEFYIGSDPGQVRWMVGQLTGTLLYLLGGCVAVHATTAVYKKNNYLVTGASGSGKSTLSLLMVAGGGSLISEDFSYLTERYVLARTLRTHVTMRRGLWQALGSSLVRHFGPQHDWDEEIALEQAYNQGRLGQRRLNAPTIFHQRGPLVQGINAVLLPRIVPEVSGVIVEELSYDCFVDAAQSSVDINMLTWPAQFFGFSPVSPLNLPDIPVFGVTLGLDYGQNVCEILELLEKGLFKMRI